MGVYIMGMEMPKDIEPGLVIEFADGIDGKRYARLYHYRHGGLTEWLEAVPVPPHGDLVDLKAPFKAQYLDEMTEEWEEKNVVRLEYAYGVCPKCKRVHYLRYLIHNDGLIHKPYEIKCINCNSYFKKEDILGSREETAPKPITKYDCIVSKSPEELAQWLVLAEQRILEMQPALERPAIYADWLDFLKQEAKE